MILPKSIEQFLQDSSSDITKISEVVKQTLFAYCEKNNFAYKQRVKSLVSVYEKLETGRYTSIQDIDDLIAATIIISNLKLEEEVINFLQTSFSVKIIRKRNSTTKPPEVFRFDSTRVICTLNNFTESSETIYNILFEIQILSAFEHAWQIATHSLSYKSSEIDWKVIRLASQLRASVEQLDTICSSYTDIKNNILESGWPDIDNKKELLKEFNSLKRNNIFLEEDFPVNMVRFIDNIFQLLKQTSGFKKYHEIEFLQQIMGEFTEFVKDKNRPKSASVFQIFQLFLFLNNKFSIQSSDYTHIIVKDLLDIYPHLQGKIEKYKTCII